MLKKNLIDQWLDDLETRNVEEIQLGLDRIMKVARELDVHKPSCRVITVAGTNGKGSTVTALETIYKSAGYNVGAYTSPHLIRFNERIRVNLEEISDEDLCDAFSIIDDVRGTIPLTYFEMTTLAALFHFKKKQLDIIILEVGLGGRLDATNIIDADLSIITTVDFDHQYYLGTTLEAIGYEKAGILRDGKPFIYADSNPPDSIMNRARELSVPTYFFNRDFFIYEEKPMWGIDYQSSLSHLQHFFFIEDSINLLPKPTIQLKSAAAAITACLLLKDDLPLAIFHFQTAMKNIFIPGRLQLNQGSINLLLDVSHNPQSVTLMANTIRGMNKRKVHAVFSALKDKDIFNLIMPLKDCVDYWYPAQLNQKRAASADLLLSCFKDAAIDVNFCYNSPINALDHALKYAEPGDLIVVYGSFFTVSHVMAHRRLNETCN